MKKLLPASLLMMLIAIFASGCTRDEIAAATISIFVILCWGIVAIIGILIFVLWIVMLIDCIKRDNDEFPGTGDNTKNIWLIVLIVTFIFSYWWIAAIVYYFTVMRKKPRKK